MQKINFSSSFELIQETEFPDPNLEREMVTRINQLYKDNQQTNLELEEKKKNYLEISWVYLVLANYLKTEPEKTKICWEEGLEAIKKFRHQPTNKELDHQTWLTISSYYLLKSQQESGEKPFFRYQHLKKAANASTKALAIQSSSEVLEHKFKYMEYLKKFWKEQKLFFNSLSYLTDEDAFASDMFQPGEIIINTPEIHEGMSPLFKAEKNSEEYLQAMEFMLKQTSSRNQLLFHLQICKSQMSDPTFLTQILGEYQDIPVIERLKLEKKARNQLANSAEKELKLALKYIRQAKSGHDALYKKIESLEVMSVGLREQANFSKIKLEEQRIIWNKKKNDFFQNLYRLLNGEIEEAQFWSSLETLRLLNPLNTEPFTLFFLFPHLFPSYLLNGFIEEASAYNPYETYATVVLLAKTDLSRDGSLTLLIALQELHPKDIYLKGLQKALKTGSNEILKLDKVEIALSCALWEIASGNLDDAIQTLVGLKPYVFGFSIVYEYLAIAWSLKGDMEKAFSFIKRIPSLMRSDASFSSVFMFSFQQRILQVLPKTSSRIPQNTEPVDPPLLLSEFIDLLNHSFEISRIESFVEKCINSLKTDNLQELPIIYLGINYLRSKLNLNKNELKQYGQLRKNLSILNCWVAEIHHEFTKGKVDSWMTENFMRKVNNETGSIEYIGSISYMTFNCLEREEFPRFEFKGLRLTRASIASIALSLTKKIHSLCIELVTVHTVSEAIFSHPADFLPDSPTLFLNILKIGFSSGIKESPQRNQSVRFLEIYLARNDETRPYQIDQDVLDWALFCKNADALPPSSLGKQMMLLKENLRDQTFDFHAAYALRDASLASEAISNRAGPTDHVIIPKDGTCFYDVFLLGQRLFGWRKDETFAAWGQRLTQLVQVGLFAPYHRRLDDHESSLPDIELPIQTDNVMDVVKHLLFFWRQFHKQTTVKNQLIANDGDEDDKRMSHPSVNWHKGLEANLWKKIIENNTPQSHPLYDKNKKAITDLVAKKHEHVIELNELRAIYKKRKQSQSAHKQDDADFDKLSAALVMTKAEGQRAHNSLNLYVADQAEAERLYRIVIEATIRRSLEANLIKSGPEEWAVRDSKKTILFLKTILEPCIGKFHGPETHPGGDAPLQIHYNVVVYTSKQNLANTHIFFGD